MPTGLPTLKGTIKGKQRRKHANFLLADGNDLVEELVHFLDFCDLKMVLSANQTTAKE